MSALCCTSVLEPTVGQNSFLSAKAAATIAFVLGGLVQAMQAVCPHCIAIGTTLMTATLAAGAGKVVWDTLQKVDAAAGDASIMLEQESLAPGGLLWLQLLGAALVALAASATVTSICSRRTRLTQGAEAFSTALLAVPHGLLNELRVAALCLVVLQVGSLFACTALVQSAASLSLLPLRPAHAPGLVGPEGPTVRPTVVGPSGPLPGTEGWMDMRRPTLGEAWPPEPLISDMQAFVFSDVFSVFLLLVLVMMCGFWLQLMESIFRGKVALTVAFWYFALDPEDVAKPLASPPSVWWVLTRRHVGTLAKHACFVLLLPKLLCSFLCGLSVSRTISGSHSDGPGAAQSGCDQCRVCVWEWAAWAQACSGQPAVCLSVFPGHDFFEAVSMIAESVPLALDTLRAHLGAASLSAFFTGASLPFLVVTLLSFVVWREPDEVGDHRSTEDTLQLMWLLILLVVALPAGLAWSTFSDALTDSLLTCCLLDDVWFQTFQEFREEFREDFREAPTPRTVPTIPVTHASSHVLWSSRLVPVRLRIFLTPKP